MFADASPNLLLVGIDVGLGLYIIVVSTMSGERCCGGMSHTLCFDSSILSLTASLAAVMRVLAPALVWPFAISDECVSAQQAIERSNW